MVSFNFKVDNKHFHDALDVEMDKIADNIFADSQDSIVSQNIIDEGTLLKSGRVVRNYLDKEIVYDVPYADVIEFGRTPGTMPPVSPLIAWVRRKGIARNETEAKSIAWAISKKIEREGTMPRPFLTPAVDKAKARLN